MTLLNKCALPFLTVIVGITVWHGILVVLICPCQGWPPNPLNNFQFPFSPTVSTASISVCSSMLQSYVVALVSHTSQQWTFSDDLEKPVHCVPAPVPSQQQQHRKRQLPSFLQKLGDKPHASTDIKAKAPDGIFNYASAFLNDGLLVMELWNAIHEGDGDRIVRTWKFMLLYFWFGRHTNYHGLGGLQLQQWWMPLLLLEKHTS